MKHRTRKSTATVTLTPEAAAAAFLAAFNAFQANRDRAALPALNAALDAALADYRTANGLPAAYGFADMIAHYNRTFASA